jgi:hypothetical protein
VVDIVGILWRVCSSEHQQAVIQRILSDKWISFIALAGSPKRSIIGVDYNEEMIKKSSGSSGF